MRQWHSTFDIRNFFDSLHLQLTLHKHILKQNKQKNLKIIQPALFAVTTSKIRFLTPRNFPTRFANSIQRKFKESCLPI